MAKKEEPKRSEQRKKAYAEIAKAGLHNNSSRFEDPQQLGVVAAIEFLSRDGLLFAPLIEFPGEDARAEYVRNHSVDAVARLAVEHLQHPTVAATELVRTLAQEPLPLQPLARQYIVGRTAMKAGDALEQIDSDRASTHYVAVLDAIAAMTEPQQDTVIDAMNALEGPLALLATWLERYGRS